MEVKIGVQYAPRELVLDSTQTPAEVEQAVTEALGGKTAGLLSLQDEKGRKVLVPVEKIGYVEIAEASPRPIGFSAG